VAVSGHGDTPDKIDDLREPGRQRLNGKLSSRGLHHAVIAAELAASEAGNRDWLYDAIRPSRGVRATSAFDV
jgi:hypothetical protein